MRYCQPLRFSAARGWLTLSEKCPHRLSFPQCTSTLCREAKEKSDWLDSVRLEARRAHDLVQSADKLWRQKLQQALEHSLQVCRETQARETDEMRKRLSQRTSSEVHLEETLHYLQKNGGRTTPAGVGGDLERLYEATGFTEEHLRFVARQVDLHRDHGKNYLTSLLDHRRADFQQTLRETQASLRLPEQVLDALRDGQERRIDYHVQRSERVVVDLLRLALGPRKPDYTQPPLENSVTLALVQRASRQATEALRGALTVFAQICEEVRRLLLPSTTAAAMTKAVSFVNTGIGSPPRSSRRANKRSTRPKSAPLPQAEQEQKGSQQEGLARPFVSEQNLFASSLYESDFEQTAQEEQPPRQLMQEELFEREDLEEEQEEEVEEEVGMTSHSSYHGRESSRLEVGDGTSTTSTGGGGAGGDYEDDFVHQSSILSQGPDNATLLAGKGPMKSSQNDGDGGGGGGGEHRRGRGSRKGKKGKHRVRLPSGSALKEELALAKLPDSKLHRQNLLQDLIGKGRGRQQTKGAMSRLRRELLNKVEEGSRYSLHFESNEDSQHEGQKEEKEGEEEQQQEEEEEQVCANCFQVFSGTAKRLPRLVEGAVGNEMCWREALTAVQQPGASAPDLLKKVRLGGEVQDQRRAFLQRLQRSALIERGTAAGQGQGQAVFCSWPCLRQRALAHCPLQRRYQTEILIDMVASGSLQDDV